MSGLPDISVVIPTRGRLRFLPLTLEGALGQEGVSVEVIVIDDASTDDTAATLARMEEPRLRVRRNEIRRGVAASRNAGLAEARAEWVALLDDDDLWSPRKLRTQLDAAIARDAAFAYAAAVIIDEDEHPTELDVPPPDPSDLPAALLAYCAMPAPGSNMVAKTALVRDLGGFDERARFDDWDMWIRLADAAPGARCPEVLTAYRHHATNRILETQHEAMPGLRYLAEKHRALTLRHGVDFDELGCRRWVAWAYRRAGARFQATRSCVATALACRTPSDLLRAALVPFGDWAIYGPRSGGAPEEPRWLAAYRNRRITSRLQGK